MKLLISPLENGEEEHKPVKRTCMYDLKIATEMISVGRQRSSSTSAGVQLLVHRSRATHRPTGSRFDSHTAPDVTIVVDK